MGLFLADDRQKAKHSITSFCDQTVGLHKLSLPGLIQQLNKLQEDAYFKTSPSDRLARSHASQRIVSFLARVVNEKVSHSAMEADDWSAIGNYKGLHTKLSKDAKKAYKLSQKKSSQSSAHQSTGDGSKNPSKGAKDKFQALHDLYLNDTNQHDFFSKLPGESRCYLAHAMANAKNVASRYDVLAGLYSLCKTTAHEQKNDSQQDPLQNEQQNLDQTKLAAQRAMALYVESIDGLCQASTMHLGSLGFASQDEVISTANKALNNDELRSQFLSRTASKSLAHGNAQNKHANTILDNSVVPSAHAMRDKIDGYLDEPGGDQKMPLKKRECFKELRFHLDLIGYKTNITDSTRDKIQACADLLGALEQSHTKDQVVSNVQEVLESNQKFKDVGTYSQENFRRLKKNLGKIVNPNGGAKKPSASKEKKLRSVSSPLPFIGKWLGKSSPKTDPGYKA